MADQPSQPGTPDGKKIVIDLSAWRTKDKNAFMKAVKKAQETGDEAEGYPALSKIVKEWPYAGDPSEPASFDELMLDDYLDVIDVVYAAMQARFQRK